MCGIAGFIGSAGTPEDRIIAGMAAAIRYRGLDAAGTWHRRGKVALVHSRLRVVDLVDGDQPMTDASGSLTIVFNGEIYNYVELRSEYERLGATFSTQSDTEVLLAGYRLKGAKVLTDLVGMFAFAIWDSRTEELFLARDRIGKKPLYWFEHAGVFMFGSTLDAFANAPGWSTELSRTCVDFYSAVGSFPLGLTAYKKGRSLPPGSFALVRVGHSPTISRYWRPIYDRKCPYSDADALDAYGAVLTDALTKRLRADVPLALTYSGGVDSGTLAALTARNSHDPVDCFTLDYDTADDPSDEVTIARSVAKELSLSWQFLQFDYHTNLLSALDDALAPVDQPCNHIAISYSQVLYRAIKPRATVVLSGNGADELFLGYDGNEEIYRRDLEESAASSARWWQRLTRKRRRIDSIINGQCDYVASHMGDYDDDHSRHEIVAGLASEIDASGITNRVDLYSYMALTYFASDANLRLPDIAGLRAQIEVRSPFLDHRMVEFAASLPSQYKIGDPESPLANKLLPKRFFATLVSPKFAWARKKGMCANVRYGDAFAKDAQFRSAYEGALRAIRDAGLDESAYRRSWEEFTAAKLASSAVPSSAGKTMAGFMLGRWLTVRAAAGHATWSSANQS